MARQVYVKRDLEKKLLEYAQMFPAVVLSGPRQSGKSTLLKKLFGATHQYVTFDDPIIRQKCLEDPKMFLAGLEEPIIFDEIQYVPQLLSYLKIAIDENRHKYGRFLLTGSQQFNLIKNLGDTLAGRAGILSLLPFSFFELSSIKGFKQTISPPEKAFIYACLNGSFPEPVVRKKLDIIGWYAGYLQTYLERDVRSLYNVGSLLEFQKFLQLLAGRCAQTLNLSGMANDLGVSVNTIKSWLSILTASGLVFLLPQYYRNIGKRLIKSPKVYFTDCGLVAYLTGFRTKEQILQGPLAGPLFENYVVAETFKLFASRGETPAMFYLRTQKGLEVDLIIERQMKLYPYEIKLTKTPRNEMIKSLEAIYELPLEIKFLNGKLVCLIDAALPLTKRTKAINSAEYFNQL